MSYPIICLAGQGGVGKDTVADLILKNIPNSFKIALADRIKNTLLNLGIPSKYLWGKSENRAKTLNPNLLNFNPWELPIDVSSFRYRAKLLKDFCARSLLQLLGLEVRQCNKNYWIDNCFEDCVYNLEIDKNLIIVPDLRFRNEILFFKSIGAKVYLVESPQGTLVKGKKAKDQSETELATVPRSWYDGVIKNDKTVPKKELLKQLKELKIID
jgi:hypothetical protein